MKVTADNHEGAYSIYVCFHILSFRTCPTFIWARYWVALAHGPVVVDYVVIHRIIVLAVITAESTLGAELALMSIHMATLEVLTAMGTLNKRKFTASNLFAQFWVQIQVAIQFS